MKMLSDEALIDAYLKSLTLGLDREFIDLLLTEIHQRDLDIQPSIAR
jgi:developmental checkpoint coupling sporulation initiation to replication initiation